MAHIYNLYVNENRTVSNDIKTPVMTRDHMVHDIVVHIPAEVDGTDMGSWFWYFVFVTPKRQKYAIPLALESVTVDDEESYNEYQATVNIGHAITNTSGKVQYAVEAVKTNSSGFVVNEWHTCTYSINIVKTLCREDADAPQQDVYETWLDRLQNLAACAMAEVLDLEDIATDTTLSISGGVADAKAVGDALAAIKTIAFTDPQGDGNIVVTLED